MKKVLELHGVVEIPNQNGQEKINKVINKDATSDRNSLPKSWFQEQGLLPPKDMEDDEIETDEEGNVILDDTDFEYVSVDCDIIVDDYHSAVGDIEFGCRVYTKAGNSYRVFEDVEDVRWLYEYHTRNWVEIFQDSIIYFFRRIKWKLQGRKEVDLAELFARPENQPDYDPNS